MEYSKTENGFNDMGCQSLFFRPLLTLDFMIWGFEKVGTKQLTLQPYGGFVILTK
jgi:hypothetical protein